MIRKFKIFESNQYTDYDPDGNFSAGDRVIVTGKYNDITFKGEVGNIINFYEAGDKSQKREILIKFDNRFNTNLMAGDNNEDPTRSSYYLTSNFVELEDKTPPKIRWYKKGKLLNEGKNDNFELGQRVIYHYVNNGYHGANREIEGFEGTVIRVRSGGQEIGVQFDKTFDDGHDCNGNGKDGYCYNVSPEEITPLEVNKLVKIRWYSKGRLSEGTRWFRNGKLEPAEKVKIKECEHKWSLRSRVMRNPENFERVMKYFLQCDLCGKIENDLEKIKKV